MDISFETKLVPQQAFLVMMVPRHHMGLKERALEHSCRGNGHLAQLGKLGSIDKYATSVVMTLGGRLHNFLCHVPSFSFIIVELSQLLKKPCRMVFSCQL